MYKPGKFREKIAIESRQTHEYSYTFSSQRCRNPGCRVWLRIRNWTGGDVMQGFLPEQAWRAVELALEAGFRHFDTAHCYATERHVGDILGRAMAEGTVKRGDLFVTTKVAHPASPPHVAISHRYVELGRS